MTSGSGTFSFGDFVFTFTVILSRVISRFPSLCLLSIRPAAHMNVVLLSSGVLFEYAVSTASVLSNFFLLALWPLSFPRLFFILIFSHNPNPLPLFPYFFFAIYRFHFFSVEYSPIFLKFFFSSATYTQPHQHSYILAASVSQSFILFVFSRGSLSTKAAAAL